MCGTVNCRRLATHSNATIYMASLSSLPEALSCGFRVLIAIHCSCDSCSDSTLKASVDTALLFILSGL